jgi:hypothetical protein
MRTLPNRGCIDESKELANLKAEPWMLEALSLNPGYVHWGPHEDYMSRDDSSWESRVIVPDWPSFEFDLNELNEVVNFYFSIERSAKNCPACKGDGLNEATRAIQERWFNYQNEGDGWEDKLTDVEVKALWDHGRLPVTLSEIPSAEEVNQHFKTEPLGHDAINRWICVEARARHQGVYGSCPDCEGKGYFFTEDEGRLALTLWVLHPRKGCSRGVMIERLSQDEFEQARTYLREAAERNADRFSKV